MSDYDNFITPNFNRVKHGNGPFTTVDDKPVPHPSTQVQDSHNNISPISLTAIGIGMLSILTMLVVRLRRGLQPATALGGQVMEMKTQDPNVNANSGIVGWGQQSSQTARPQTLCYASRQEMEALAEANPDFLGKSLGLWDPLGCLDLDFWNIGNEATIGYLRHAEIKHGRVAMAGFLGYLAQSTPLVNGPHKVLPFKGYQEGLTPPEQWDAIPLYGKLQIFVFVGMLESYGEGAGQPEGYVHYTKGGLTGYFPPIAGRAGFGQVTLNLYDPLGWFNEDKDKVRGRQVEINNGRLAMLGIFSFLAESKAPGAVPPLTGLIPEYSGNYMVPFEGDFSIFYVPVSKVQARPATQLAASDYSQELGAQAPAGFWDPLGLSDGISQEQFDRYREVEQKHGRIAMIATIGYVFPEKIGTFGDLKLSFSEGVKFSDVPNGVQALFKIPALGLLQILLLIGILETQFPNVNGDYGTGYFGRSLEEPEKSRKLAIELANGRLAMLAIMGLLTQDVVTQGQPLAISAKFPEGTFQSL